MSSREIDHTPILLEQYKILMSTSDTYFDYSYRVISMTLVFFAAIIAFIFTIDHGQNSRNVFIQFVLFKYALPIMLYILGLLYSYNTCVMARIGLFAVMLENRLFQDVSPSVYQGWVTFSKAKENISSTVVSYGPMYAFYMIAPIVSIKISPDIGTGVFLRVFFPLICFVFFFVFDLLTILKMILFTYETRNVMKEMGIV